jgi:SAM-dependent methyltransferase
VSRTLRAWASTLLARRPARGDVRAAAPAGSEREIPVGGVRFGDLGRTEPVGRAWGFDRGTPVDRYYIERFLGEHADDVRGRVLEVGDDAYTRRFGGAAVERADVLHVREGAPGATIVADLALGDGVPSEAFDCVIFTQTLQMIYDAGAAVGTLGRILKPGGVLLATLPGISQIDSGEWAETWYWSFTTRSARRLFGDVFSPEAVSVEAHGNVLAAVSFLHGLAAEELAPEALDVGDPAFELLIAVRAVKRP